MPSPGVLGRAYLMHRRCCATVPRVARFGLFEANNDKFGLFYIGWSGHFLEFIKYLAFFKVYRSIN